MNPPRLATWLLQRWMLGPNRESLVGDLVEQYQHGRSSAWYWRQALAAVLAGSVAEVWNQKLLIACVLATSVYLLNWIYTFVLWPTFVVRLYLAWYPPLIRWLLAKDLDAIRLAVYRVRLENLTSTLVWCVLLTTAVWSATRICPRQRRLIATVFLVSQIGQCLPYLHDAFENWLRYRANDPSWFFTFLMFSLYVFAALPSCVFVGTYHGRSVEGEATVVD